MPSVRICSNCTQLREKQFHTVYRYIVDHPDTTIPTVVEETEVPEKLVLEFIQQGRIQVSGEAMACAQCQQRIPELHLNARIYNDRIYCLGCLKNLSGQIQSCTDSADRSFRLEGGSAQNNDRRYGLGRD
jgi:hypothetical protein